MNLSPDTKQGSQVEAFEYPESRSGVSAQSDATQRLGPIPMPGRVSPEEMERRLAEARAQGIREGLEQAQQSLEAQLAGERDKLAGSVQDFQKQIDNYYRRAEEELVHLSLAIAGRILHREAQVDRMLVAALVKVALDKLQQGTKVVVRVRPEDVADWTQYFGTIMRGRIEVEIKADAAIEPHNCLLETELGVTELGLDAQLKEVGQGFFDLLAQRPGSK